MFAVAFAQVLRYRWFLSIITDRHGVSGAAWVAAATAAMAPDLGPGTQTVPREHSRLLYAESLERSYPVHLDVESFYLFAKILLDHVARAVEFYFGKARDLSLDSHDDFTKRAGPYLKTRGIAVSDAFAARLHDLKRRIADLRDYQIAHEKSPRASRGTMFNMRTGGNVRVSYGRMFPKEGEVPIESEQLGDLLAAIDAYLADVIALIRANGDKTALRLQRQ
jgi:hypothetical protein